MRQSIAAFRGLTAAPHLLAIVVARGVSSVGDWLYLAALPILLYQATGDVALVGLISAGRLLPWLLLSIPAGIVVDRMPTRTLLLATEAIRAALMLLMGFLALTDAPLPAILVSAVVAAGASTFAMPAFGRYVPLIARGDEQLGRANVVGSGLDSLACIVGPGIAALMIVVGGLELAFVLNGLSFLAMALVLARTTAPADRRTSGGRCSDPKPALSTLFPAILRPLAIDAAISFMAGLLMVLPVLVVASIGGGDTFAGMLSLAAGAGGVGGAGMAAFFIDARLRRGLATALALATGGFVLFGLAASPFMLLAGIVIAAAAIVALDTLNLTQVQRTLDDRVLGRGLGLINTSAAIWVIVGSLVPTLVVEAVGLPALMLGSAGIVAILGGAGMCPIPRLAVGRRRDALASLT